MDWTILALDNGDSESLDLSLKVEAFGTWQVDIGRCPYGSLHASQATSVPTKPDAWLQLQFRPVKRSLHLSYMDVDGSPSGIK